LLLFLLFLLSATIDLGGFHLGFLGTVLQKGGLKLMQVSLIEDIGG
jgi:hypothetical protein